MELNRKTEIWLAVAGIGVTVIGIWYVRRGSGSAVPAVASPYPIQSASGAPGDLGGGGGGGGVSSNPLDPTAGGLLGTPGGNAPVVTGGQPAITPGPHVVYINGVPTLVGNGNQPPTPIPGSEFDATAKPINTPAPGGGITSAQADSLFSSLAALASSNPAAAYDVANRATVAAGEHALDSFGLGPNGAVALPNGLKSNLGEITFNNNLATNKQPAQIKSATNVTPNGATVTIPHQPGIMYPDFVPEISTPTAATVRVSTQPGIIKPD